MRFREIDTPVEFFFAQHCAKACKSRNRSSSLRLWPPKYRQDCAATTPGKPRLYWPSRASWRQDQRGEEAARCGHRRDSSPTIRHCRSLHARRFGRLSCTILPGVFELTAQLSGAQSLKDHLGLGGWQVPVGVSRRHIFTGQIGLLMVVRTPSAYCPRPSAPRLTSCACCHYHA